MLGRDTEPLQKGKGIIRTVILLAWFRASTQSFRSFWSLAWRKYLWERALMTAKVTSKREKTPGQDVCNTKRLHKTKVFEVVGSPQSWGRLFPWCKVTAWIFGKRQATLLSLFKVWIIPLATRMIPDITNNLNMLLCSDEAASLPHARTTFQRCKQIYIHDDTYIILVPMLLVSTDTTGPG